MQNFNFGEWLKATRKAEGISQAALEEKTGILRTNISHIENNYFGVTLVTALNIIEALGYRLNIVKADNPDTENVKD